MLTIQNITKSFGGVQAIQGSDFFVEQGKITALIGPNGAGKTTLFDIITGFLSADTGSVEFLGNNITKKSPHQIARAGISRTFQQVRLFKHLTILEHLRMVEGHGDTNMFRQLFSSNKGDRTVYEDILQEFGIERELDAPAGDLSYGQRKLLDIAMRLRLEHSLLMLDEPVAGVNKVIQERIEQLLLLLKAKGETMLVIDHDMSFIRKLADHCVVLDAGVVITQGTPTEVLRDPRVLEAYLGE